MKQYDKLKEYFKVGEIVKAYGGYDRVIELNIGESSKISWSDWSVTVQAVVLSGGEWVTDRNYPYPRTHCTTP